MPRPKRPWFRVYVEMLSDLKVRRLTPTERWIWVAILAAARQSPVPGELWVHAGVPMTAGELADFADVPRRSMRTAIDKMSTLGMLELRQERDATRAANVHETGKTVAVLVVVNWADRQFDSDDVTSRVSAHRARNGTGKERSNDPGSNVPTGDVGTFRASRARVGAESETESEGLNQVNGGGGSTSGLPFDPPPPWCDKHPGGTDEPCRRCGIANRERRAWDTEHEKAEATAKRDAIARRQNCPDCHGGIWLEGGTKCDHPRSKGLSLITGGTA